MQTIPAGDPVAGGEHVVGIGVRRLPVSIATVMPSLAAIASSASPTIGLTTGPRNTVGPPPSLTSPPQGAYPGASPA